MYNCRANQKGRLARALVIGIAVDVVKSNMEEQQKNKKNQKNIEKKRAQK